MSYRDVLTADQSAAVEADPSVKRARELQRLVAAAEASVRALRGLSESLETLQADLEELRANWGGK